MCHILCIETASPSHAHQQEDLASYYAESAPAADTVSRRRIRAVSKHSGITQRYSVLPDFSQQQSGENILFRSITPETVAPGISERMHIFRKEALCLSVQAVQAIMGFEQIKSEITHLITVTCTGLFAPGLDIELIRELGLRRTVQRSSINFMGCNAALLAMKQAGQICAGEKNALVLIVCTEICTIHFQRDYSEDSILSNMLFGDGSAAALMGSPRAALSENYRPLRISNFHSLILHEGFGDMAWQLSEKGFLMNLSSYVSGLLNTNMKNVFRENNIDPDEIRHWAIHPGGRKILDEFCSAMGLERSLLSSAYSVLSQYGNMSSATILFVIRKLCDTTSIGEGEKIYSAAFGPGLTIEAAILQYV